MLTPVTSLNVGRPSRLRPAVQQARSEGAVVASARDREVRRRRQRVGRTEVEEGALLRERREVVALEFLHVARVPGKVANAGRKTHDGCGGLQGNGHRGAALDRRARREGERDRDGADGGERAEPEEAGGAHVGRPHQAASSGSSRSSDSRSCAGARTSTYGRAASIPRAVGS